jgi:hypothetical protein
MRLGANFMFSAGNSGMDPQSGRAGVWEGSE